MYYVKLSYSTGEVLGYHFHTLGSAREFARTKREWKVCAVQIFDPHGNEVDFQ